MKYHIEKVKNYSEECREAVNELLKQLNKKAVYLSRNELEEIIASSYSNLFVAELEDKKIIGMATLILFRTISAKRGIVEDVVVDRNYRKRGVGAKLIEEVLKKAKEEKFLYLDLTSRPQRKAANRFYQNFGFVKRMTNVYRLKL